MARVWNLLPFLIFSQQAKESLRSYIEGTQFGVRTDHDGFNWMLNLSDPQERVARWRMSLRNFDFTVSYGQVLKKKVPDALSKSTTEDYDEAEIEDEITTDKAHALVLNLA